eukprot:scaffold52583_cov58-Phaeocystis_antarctica.AAC.2
MGSVTAYLPRSKLLGLRNGECLAAAVHTAMEYRASTCWRQSPVAAIVLSESDVARRRRCTEGARVVFIGTSGLGSMVMRGKLMHSVLEQTFSEHGVKSSYVSVSDPTNSTAGGGRDSAMLEGHFDEIGGPSACIVLKYSVVSHAGLEPRTRRPQAALLLTRVGGCGVQAAWCHRARGQYRQLPSLQEGHADERALCRDGRHTRADTYATRGSNPGLADFARDHSPHVTVLQTGLLLTRVSLALGRRARRAAGVMGPHCRGAATLARQPAALERGKRRPAQPARRRLRRVGARCPSRTAADD